MLKSYANNIPLIVLGTFKAVVVVGAKFVQAEFFVIKGGQRYLLGDATSKLLGILKVGLEVDHVAESLKPEFPIAHVYINVTASLPPNCLPALQNRSVLRC